MAGRGPPRTPAYHVPGRSSADPGCDFLADRASSITCICVLPSAAFQVGRASCCSTPGPGGAPNLRKRSSSPCSFRPASTTTTETWNSSWVTLNRKKCLWWGWWKGEG